jgi:hypothetical protein
MKTADFLVELASLEHFPADFDPHFFDEIAERFFLCGNFDFTYLRISSPFRSLV